MIEVKELVKHYGDVRAVQGVTFSIQRGELFCFLGPNGAGKTTTIKMMCGLLRPTSGTIHIGGYDLSKDGREVRKVTGYIPDMPFMYDLLTLKEFLDFTGELYEIEPATLDKERDYLIELFGLVEHRQSLVRDLSHGLRQRLVYASTLLQDPKIMFVDEPFVGLDPHSIRLIKDLLREKASQGTTIFLTTHILALAESMADRIGIISEGKIVAIGDVDEIVSGQSLDGSLEDVFLMLTGSLDEKV